MRKDLLPYYRALGLSPGAGPAEIRRAYRHLVQQWHPDLFKPGSPMQTTAEDITKEINEAYGQLFRKKLYRHYPPKEEAAVGVADEPPDHPGAAAPRRGRPAPKPRRPAPRAAPKRRRRDRARDWVRRLWRRRGVKPVLGLVVLAAVVRLGVSLWAALPPFAAPVHQAVVGTPVAGPDRPAAAEDAAAPAPDPVAAAPTRSQEAPAPERVVREAPLGHRILDFGTPRLSLRPPVAESFGSAPRGAETDKLAGAAALIAELFESGDPKARVLAVQGPPDEAGDSVFRYGSSLVYFRNGRVRGWVDRLPRLRVRSWDEAAMPSLDRFSVGSSRGEVERAQGRPDAFSIDRYLYGSSEVTFAQDRVAGWSTGDVPLHAFDLPLLPFGGLDRNSPSAR